MRTVLLLTASALISLQPMSPASAADEKPAKEVVTVKLKIEFHFPGVEADEIVLGDSFVTVVQASPAVLVTTPVKRALLGLREPSGFDITRARIRTSGFFRRHSPGKRLPAFWALQVRGKAGRDDMGLTAAGVLVVSRRVLDVLLDFRIGRAFLAQYAPRRPASRGTS